MHVNTELSLQVKAGAVRVCLLKSVARKRDDSRAHTRCHARTRNTRAIEHEPWYSEDRNATDNIAALKQKLRTHPVLHYIPGRFGLDSDWYKFFGIIKAVLDKKKMKQEVKQACQMHQHMQA